MATFPPVYTEYPDPSLPLLFHLSLSFTLHVRCGVQVTDVSNIQYIIIWIVSVLLSYVGLAQTCPNYKIFESTGTDYATRSVAAGGHSLDTGSNLCIIYITLITMATVISTSKINSFGLSFSIPSAPLALVYKQLATCSISILSNLSASPPRP